MVICLSSADIYDFSVPFLDQMSGGEISAAGVVYTDPVKALAVCKTFYKYDRNTAF